MGLDGIIFSDFLERRTGRLGTGESMAHPLARARRRSLFHSLENSEIFSVDLQVGNMFASSG